MALLQTDLLSAFTQTFRQDRQMFVDGGLQEGVVGAGDFKVTPGGASLQWSVAAGAAWVQGDDTTRQGLYHQINDAAVTGLISAGHATLPRIDQVVLQLADSSVAGVSNTPTLITVAGTATSGATLDNRTGAAALPNTALRLADILVPAAQTGVISAANIRDRRPWARGAFKTSTVAGGNYSVAGASATLLDATNLQPRLECSGAPVRVSVDLFWMNSSAAVNGVFSVFLDGVVAGSTPTAQQASVAAGLNNSLHYEAVFTPAPGSHLIGLAAARAAGTMTVVASGANPVQMVVQELVRQNTDNT